ncbi:MAG: triose-phosphate isomerase [Zetaproteobacteria bacterium]|nr:triose-phosphate isomerase [Pseudobdellovibrionaceae bacterium]
MLNLSNFSSFFVANWKLNGNMAFINDYFDALNTKSQNCVVVCPPSIYIDKIKKNQKNIFAGAQDVSKFISGAFTGELSAEMLNDMDVKFCLVGHSERRQNFNETNDNIKLKIGNLINNNIIPILCIGESLEEKQNNKTTEVLTKQIKEGIPKISNNENTIIAYEPIWAIGTGLTPTINEIDQIHVKIKKIDDSLNNYKILYGGSVKSSNSKVINEIDSVDGCLIGGASLKIEEFNNIIS